MIESGIASMTRTHRSREPCTCSNRQRVLEQAAKTDAEKRKPFQKFVRNIRRAIPDHERRSEEFVVAENRHSHLEKSAILRPP